MFPLVSGVLGRNSESKMPQTNVFGTLIEQAQTKDKMKQSGGHVLDKSGSVHLR